MSRYTAATLEQLARQRLLRNENLDISSLKYLPAQMFPGFFIEAHTHRYYEILKVLVQNWPFEKLPLGDLTQDLFPEDSSFKAVMDGIGVLLKQNVYPRCKLKVLDLQCTGKKFWSVWTGASFPVFSCRRELSADRPSRKEKSTHCLEVSLDVYLEDEPKECIYSYLLNWIKDRTNVHLSCKRLIINSLSDNDIQLLHTLTLCDIKNLEMNCMGTYLALNVFVQFLGKMRNLKRLVLCINFPTEITMGEQENRAQFVTQFTSALLTLKHLQELYLDSPSFLQGHLDQMLRCLSTPLEAFSVTDCMLTEDDLTALFRSPHLTQLNDLSLRGIHLTSFTEPLQALLEKSAATLQHLDLALCGLEDSHLEAMLPALSNCSKLSSLNFHGNHLSMACLEKLLCCTSGLKDLSLQLFPAPLESFIFQGALLPASFTLICTKILNILKNLRLPRSIMLSTAHCSYCSKKVFMDWKPIIRPCFPCVRKYKKLSFRLEK